MKKFYLANGEEVQIGDVIAQKLNVKDSVSSNAVTHYITVTQHTLPSLLKAGILTTDNPNENSQSDSKDKVPMDLEYYEQKIADRLGWKIEKVCNYLNNTDTILPSAAFSMILREIAIELDKKYEDHIQDSPEIYVISMFDGRITKANKAYIKNYRNFAAFRSVEDAKIACEITKDLLKDLFKSGK